MKKRAAPTRAFNERETISEPICESTIRALPREPVIALRFQGRSGEVPLLVEQQTFTVGAARSCDVIVEDRYASAKHCVLERRDLNRLIARDLTSKNGTYVNGLRIEQAELRPGALLGIGKTTLVAVGQSSRGTATAFERLRGRDPAFREAVDLAIAGASSSCSILIVGETGTGKELVARAVHEASPRSARPFVAINCGAIPRELIGSELFGHEKGAFTGATGQHDGVFMQANGGTLFLDEIGELPIEQQPHLLRVLETRHVRRVGSKQEVPIDIRVVSATNRLSGLGTDTGDLRPDLYHRIATIVVSLPPLRDRPEDIPVLVRGFINDLADDLGPRTISRETLRLLQGYSWPGNIRELQHAVQRAVALCPGELTVAKLLPQRFNAPRLGPQKKLPSIQLPLSVRDSPDQKVTPDHKRTRRRGKPRSRSPDSDRLSVMELLLRDAMIAELEKHGSIRKAAKALGMPKSTFADRAKRYGISTG